MTQSTVTLAATTLYYTPYIGNFIALQRNAISSISGDTNDTVFYTHVSK